jgi:SAM-dependent methyltransferase
MEAVEYQRMFDAERRSWWFCARREILSDVIGRIPLPPEPALLDMGCGTGGNLLMLEQFGQPQGVEYSPLAADFARQRTGAPITVASATDTGLAAESFDLITMLDVLEHIDDDEAALAEVTRLLKPGGAFLLTVPAFMFLWSQHDVVLHHKRRYRRRPLQKLLTAAGLQIDWLSYYNTFLFPPVASVRLARRLLPDAKPSTDSGDHEADGTTLPPAPINATLKALFAVERHVIGRMHLPIGVSLIGVARKP